MLLIKTNMLVGCGCTVDPILHTLSRPRSLTKKNFPKMACSQLHSVARQMLSYLRDFPSKIVYKGLKKEWVQRLKALKSFSLRSWSEVDLFLSSVVVR